MFSKLFRTKIVETKKVPTQQQVEKFSFYEKTESRFSIPDWDRVDVSLAERLLHDDPNLLWSSVAASWLDKLRSALGGSYGVSSSNHFLLLSGGSEREAKLFLDYAEKTRKRILHLLDGIASDGGYGKSCVMAFADIDAYYEYVANYYPAEGEYAFSSGMYINDGYGHFVYVAAEMVAIEPIIAHELTHMQLTHLPLPAWLNEGLAVNTENILSPRFGSHFTPAEMRSKHGAFWNEQTIQEFWSGKSFLRADDGNLLSYDLAKQLTTLISQNRASFVNFANAADMFDSGQQAADDHLGIPLEHAVSHLLGAGNWRPEPSLWGYPPERGGFTD
jgi:hypothetical protein